jgi:hypothetical protein
MARTINEILTEANVAQERVGELYTVITNEVNADANLSGLTSTSKTAEFNLWKYIWSAMAYIQEAIWGESQSEIQSIVDAAIPGTEKWFQKELLKFQYGDTLSFDTVTAKYFYAVIDATKQIIKRCAVVSNGGVTNVKVAKDDGSGNPIPLTSPQLTAFISYVRQIQWAGANISNPISLNSDKLNVPMTIHYDGVLDLPTLKTIIEAAWLGYLATLPFNAEYRISAHQDYVQDALKAVSPNYNDVVMGTVQAKPDAGTYATVLRINYPVSGYFEKDPAIAFSTMLTYVAH